MMKKVNFNLLIEKEIKEKFIRLAKLNDETASQLVRKFIKEYVKNNSNLEDKNNG